MLRSFLAGASRLCRQAGAASAARSTPPPPLARGYKKRYLDAAAVGDIYVKGKGTTIPPGSPIVIGQNMAGILSLNNLRDNPGSRKTITRVGRGIGSGKGKTCGRGHKGQKSRSGRSFKPGFEGGQTPLMKRIRKKGFVNFNRIQFQALNLSKVKEALESRKIDPLRPITMKTLYDARVVSNFSQKWDGVKLLGVGAEGFDVPINIEVSRCSESAKAAILAAGGSVTKVHYNRLGLRALLKPHKWEQMGRPLPHPARPPPRLVSRVDRAGTLPPPS